MSLELIAMPQKSGIFLVNKPENMTSNDLVQIIKRKFKFQKVGHAGTLDPLATGLMVILINQATKISNFILMNDKAYRVKIKMFLQTDSFDITGKVIDEMTPFKISAKEIKKVVEDYNGYMYDQYPPIYSAIKVNGKKLYEYARKNQEVKVEPRTVTINSCSLVDYDAKQNEITLDVSCSKGTYIRSFVNDFMKKLDAIGTVKELCRTKSGNFELEEAIEVDDLTEENMYSMYDALMMIRFPQIMYHQERDIRQGKSIKIVTNNANEVVSIVNDKHDVLAIYKRAAHGIYVCVRGLWEPEDIRNMTEAEKEEL
jgi:tRNA pseudouridine55 synthase